MGALAHSSIDPAVRRIPNTSAMHNASVDEDAAREGECAQVHLPTGRTCTLPHGHERSCEFISAARRSPAWLTTGPTAFGNSLGWTVTAYPLG